MARIFGLKWTLLLFVAFLFAIPGLSAEDGQEERDEEDEEWDEKWEEEGAELDEDEGAEVDVLGYGANNGQDVKAAKRTSCGKRFHEQDFPRSASARGGGGGGRLKVRGGGGIVEGRKAVKGAYPWQV